MDLEAQDDIERRQQQLIALVWPDGLSERDRVVMDAVPASNRKNLLDRLEAVWRAERGEPLGPLADLARLKRAAFYNLRVAWRTHSLAGLVPHDTRSGRRVDASDESPLRKEAETLLRSNPLSRNVDVARRIMEANPDLVRTDAGANHALTVLQRLQRLVGDERRRLTGDPKFVRAAFGGEMVLDLTAVQIVLDGTERALAVAAILMETASGIVLGSALGRKDDGRALQREALSAGLSFLQLNRADLPPQPDTMPGLGWMLPPDIHAESLIQTLEPHVSELVMGRAGGFSFGQQVQQVTGPRIGRIPLNSRRTLLANMDIDEYLKSRVAPIAALEEARGIWMREVERHNVDRIVALTRANIIGGGVTDGRLAAVIRASLVALQSA